MTINSLSWKSTFVLEDKNVFLFFTETIRKWKMGDIRNRQSQCCQMTATPVLCPSPESYPICASSCSTEFIFLVKQSFCGAIAWNLIPRAICSQCLYFIPYTLLVMQNFFSFSYLLDNIKACINFWLSKCNQKAHWAQPPLKRIKKYMSFCAL